MSDEREEGTTQNRNTRSQGGNTAESKKINEGREILEGKGLGVRTTHYLLQFKGSLGGKEKDGRDRKRVPRCVTVHQKIKSQEKSAQPAIKKLYWTEAGGALKATKNPLSPLKKQDRRGTRQFMRKAATHFQDR